MESARIFRTGSKCGAEPQNEYPDYPYMCFHVVLIVRPSFSPFMIEL